jgi:mRNA interferase RelE/StbE
MFDVRLSESAGDFYRRADEPLARKLKRCFEQLEREPVNHRMIRPLKGSYAGCHRYRVGDHRVVYKIDHAAEVVNVLVIVHRGKAYE